MRNKVTPESYRKALETLTDNEVEALQSFWESSNGNGHDFGWSNDVRVQGMNMKQVGGVISSLVKKQVINDPDTDEFHGQTEFVAYTNEGFGKYDAAEIVAEFLKTRKISSVIPEKPTKIKAKPDRSDMAALMAWVRSFKKA